MTKISLILAATASRCFALGFGSALCLFPGTNGEDYPQISTNHLVGYANPAPLLEVNSKRTWEVSSVHSTFTPSAETAKRELQSTLVDQILSGRGRAIILQETTVSDALADWLGMTSDERKHADQALQEALSNLKLERNLKKLGLNGTRMSSLVVLTSMPTIESLDIENSAE
jgi:hypothetical protein